MEKIKTNVDTETSQTTTPEVYNDDITQAPLQKHSNKKRMVIASLILIISILFLGGVTWKIMDRQNSSRPTSEVSSINKSSTNSEHFFGHNIPMVNCSQVKQWVQNAELLDSSKARYVCYKGEFTVDGEKMQKVSISLTPEYEHEWSSNHPSTCVIDCGSSPGDYPPPSPESENITNIIVRANGNIEQYTGSGGGVVESLLTDVTGCASGSNFGILDKLGDGSLVLDNNRLGLSSKFSALKVTDSNGNVCILKLEIISYITSTSGNWDAHDSMRVKSATVHYDLKKISSCSSKQAISERQSCYTPQATMRNDATICDNIVTHGGLTAGYDDCVIAVAKRNRNPQDCDKIHYYREQYLKQCQTDAKNLQSILKDDLIIN